MDTPFSSHGGGVLHYRAHVDIYPHVVLWRGDFFPTKPILALVDSVDGKPLSTSALTRAGRQISGGRLPDEAFKAVTLPFYVGNLGRARRLVPEGPLNTDDRPLVEYLSPISHRRPRSGAASWFHMEQLVDFEDALHRAVPPENDAYLARLDPSERDYVRAGLSYYKAAVLKKLGSTVAAKAFFQDFVALLPVEFLPDTDEERIDTEFVP